MTRSKRRKEPRENVLESVFGVKLGAAAAGDTDPPAPNPKPEVGPAVTPASRRFPVPSEDRVIARERKAHLATARSVAADIARENGIKHQRAHSFVKLLDLSGIAEDSDGDLDETEIARIVRAGAEEYPEFQTRASLYGTAPGGK